MIKKTLWVSIPILVLVSIYPYVNISLENYFAISLPKIEGNTAYKVIQIMSLFIVLAGVSKITIITLFRKEFFLCLAKGYFESIIINDATGAMDQTDQMRFLVKGLEAYNEYMIKIFNRKINSIDKIIKIILTSNDNNSIIKKIKLKFKESTNFDALEPLRTILEYSSDKSKIGNKVETELFLEQKSTREKVTHTMVFLTTMLIPVAIALINLYRVL